MQKKYWRNKKINEEKSGVALEKKPIL